jgi:hypothetical protein
MRAQQDPTADGVYLGIFYGYQVPVGDLADRFGRNSSLGGNLEFFVNQKWIIGVEGQFIFGPKVKENVLGGLVTSDGTLINTSFTLADVDIKERGFNLMAKFGRIHDLWSPRHISGIKWTIGAGWLQHKIRLKDSQNAIPYFEDPYIKGYDRLTNGLALTQFLGYQYLDDAGRLNVFFGAELTEAITKNRRGLNYNTNTLDEQSRFDMLAGLKFGIQITINRFKEPGEIWY